MSSDDDDLTDITALPDFDEEEDEQSFASLDELAKEVGLEDELTPPDLPTPPDFEEPAQSEESSFDEFGSDNDEDSSFEEENSFGDDFSANEEESNFGDDFSSDDEDSNFGSDFSEDSNDDVFNDDSDFSDNDSFEETSFDDSTNDDFSFSDQEEENETKSDDEFDEDKTDPNIDISALHTEPDLPSEGETNEKPQFTSAADLTPPAPKPEKIKKTPLEKEVKTHQTPPEQFEEFKSFAQTMTFSNFSSEGNPPFSIILKNLTYIEDVEEITSLLIELKVVEESSKESTEEMLKRGQLLIPRLSEYAAIYLCHRLRRFDVEILMGLTEEVNPPKSYESNDRGLSSKRTILANKKHHYHFKDTHQVQDVLVTTLQHLNDYKIIKYLGVVSENKTLSAKEIGRTSLEDEMIQQAPSDSQDNLYLNKIKRENQLATNSQNKFNYLDFYASHEEQSTSPKLDQVYQDLSSKMIAKAKIAGANGIVGLKYEIGPLAKNTQNDEDFVYQILCTGNLVWIERT